MKQIGVCFESVAVAIQSYDPFSRVMCEERKMAIENIQLQTAL